MFAEALRALATFTTEATGHPTRIGATAVDLAPGREAGSGRAATAGDPAITLSLVSVIRTERLRNVDREVAGAQSANTVSLRQGPGWYDLTVAVEPGGDQLAAAESIERLLTAVLRAGDLATALTLDSDYPVYAAMETPTAEELQTWWQHGLTSGRGAALRAVVTVALQPNEPEKVEIVQRRRINVDDLRTKVRETVER
jgi:hypothetical protein